MKSLRRCPAKCGRLDQRVGSSVSDHECFLWKGHPGPHEFLMGCAAGILPRME